MNGEYPYRETDSFMEELKRAAFNAIYKDGCDNCGDWIDTLVNCYSEEVVDALGNNPNEVMRIGRYMGNRGLRRPSNWYLPNLSELGRIFRRRIRHTIYDELVKAKQTNELK